MSSDPERANAKAAGPLTTAMPAKCNCCGVETTLGASFFRERRSFSRSVLIYCPRCWNKRRHSALKGTLLRSLGLGVLGPVLVLVLPGKGIGWVFLNLFFGQIFLALTIVPHELGHAWMARWLGMRIFKIFLGSGKTLFTARLFAFDVEFRSVPLGGMTLAAHRTVAWLRARHFAYVLAGPAVNLLLAAAVWSLLDASQLWSFQPLERGPQFGLMFFYANLLVLVENLWPRNVATPLGAFPSDGKQLLETLFLSREKRELCHATTFVMEASASHERGDYEGAQTWAEKGLVLYPDNEMLLTWHGVIAVDRGEYGKARACFLKVLHRDSKQPLMRPMTLNNIAYADALLGGGELLKEADEFSQEAMTAMNWMPAVKGTRGTVLAAMGQLEEALPLLHEAMLQAESPNNKASTACMISIAETRRGNLDAARNLLREARTLDPKCHLFPRAEAVLREASPPPA